MIYNNIFIKYKPDMSLQNAISLFKELKTRAVSPIKYRIVEMVCCTETDIENVLKSGKLLKTCHGYISNSQNGIWGCIALYSKSALLLLYTSGHQTPLYFSVIYDSDIITKLKHHYNDQSRAELSEQSSQ